ncbi:MAG: response regulator, partial [Dechloromonas sp.]|nr:response regulator [Candidatus Dechloromonas phosphorivorans]
MRRGPSPASLPAATAGGAPLSGRLSHHRHGFLQCRGHPTPTQHWPVLVADDSAVARAKLRKLLEGAGFIDVANDGERALDLLSRKSYAVLITDLEMPVLDSFRSSPTAGQPRNRGPADHRH